MTLTCDRTHVVLNTDLHTAHLTHPDAPGETLCGEHLRHPAAPAAVRWDCPRLTRHCADCEGVLAGNAVVIGGELTYV